MTDDVIDKNIAELVAEKEFIENMLDYDKI